MRSQQPRFSGRAAERRVVGIRAQLREAGGTRFDVDVEDLSVTGFRVDTIYRVPVGAHVFLMIPTFAALEAKVAWTNDKGYGCHFVQPLHPAVFDTIAARYPGI